MDKTKYTRPTFIRRDLLVIKQTLPDGTEEDVKIHVALNAADEFWAIIDETVERTVINIMNMLPKYQRGKKRGLLKHITITKDVLFDAKKIVY